MVKPYVDKKLAKGIIRRVFSESVESQELVWHRDREHRQVLVVEGKNWLIQFDNQLPTSLKEGDTVEIPANTYHRIIKGTSSLIVEITEGTNNEQ